MHPTQIDYNSNSPPHGLGGLLEDIGDPPSECFQYETIKFSGRLEILDPEGGAARFIRHQRVRFLEDGVSVFMDRVWGDGILFASYAAQGLRILDAIPTRKGYVVLLALAKPAVRGETFDVVTQRRIVGAFTKARGYWESAVYAPTEKLSLEVLSPEGRSMAHSDISAPSVRGLRIEDRPRALKLDVRQPALNVPYRLTWAWT